MPVETAELTREDLRILNFGSASDRHLDELHARITMQMEEQARHYGKASREDVLKAAVVGVINNFHLRIPPSGIAIEDAMKRSMERVGFNIDAYRKFEEMQRGKERAEAVKTGVNKAIVRRREGLEGKKLKPSFEDSLPGVRLQPSPEGELHELEPAQQGMVPQGILRKFDFLWPLFKEMTNHVNRLDKLTK